MHKDDGGPAFPVTVPDKYGRAPSGMTLRDWFAGQALPVVHHHGGRYGPQGLKQVAEQAYEVADAMLAARKGQGDDQG